MKHDSTTGWPQAFDLGQTSQLYEALFTDQPAHLASDEVTRIGDYLVDEEIGEGGGGRVFTGVRLGSDKRVALKLLRTPLAGGRTAQRAWRELEVLEQLDTPTVPRLHDHGVHDDCLFLVYDHIDGEPLDAYCRNCGLDLRMQVQLIARVARAIQDLHERGFIHRDIKPSNVLVSASGDPYVIDLGLATLIDATETGDLTGHARVGTLRYMAPEQAAGRRDQVSIRSDVYSLGATAWLLLTATTPREATPDDGVGPIAPDIRRLDASIPKSLAIVLNRAVAARPDDRFASALDFAADLERWVRHEPVLSQRPSWWRNRALAVRRRPGLWAACIAMGLLTLGLTATTVVGQVRHVNERLELLEDLQAKQAWIDDTLGFITATSQRFRARLAAGEYKEAWKAMKLIEDHALAAANVDRPVFIDADADASRDELTRSAIRAIYDSFDHHNTREELVHAAVRAMFAEDWSDELATELDVVLDRN